MEGSVRGVYRPTCYACDYAGRDYRSDDKAKRVIENHDARFHYGEPTGFVAAYEEEPEESL